MIRKYDLKQAGDTIVEVLIAMAVVSLVLGGAYAVTQRTLANAQQSQEHSEALKLAEGQLERLSDAYAANKTQMEAQVTCIADDGSVKSAVNNSADCKFGTDSRYNVAAQYNGAPGSFTVGVTWDGPTGATDNVSLAYKVLLQ